MADGSDKAHSEIPGAIRFNAGGGADYIAFGPEATCPLALDFPVPGGLRVWSGEFPSAAAAIAAARKELDAMDVVRPDGPDAAWRGRHFDIMTEILTEKFSPERHPELSEALMATTAVTLLVSADVHLLWGIGVDLDTVKEALVSGDFPGDNALGMVLMRVRAALFTAAREAEMVCEDK